MRNNDFYMIVHRDKNNDYSSFKSLLFKDFLKAYPYFSGGMVTYNVWSLKEYQKHYSVGLKQLIEANYMNSDGDFYWAGDYYKSYEDILEDLNQQKVILELNVNNLSIRR